MQRITPHLLICGMVLLWAFAAKAETGCTLIVDQKTAEIIHESGDCKTRRGAQSTFKIPLALMGFDSGILKDAHNPKWDYKTEYNADMEMNRHATDPARWEKDSVVWFSQKLTREMGIDKFRAYVNNFNYGNKDISGDAGKDNGLTHSWLSSSLQISPVEQIAFVRGVLNRSYNIAPDTYDKTMEIIPTFEADGWNIHGKTGTGYSKHKDGSINKNSVEGWFVGWATKDDRAIVFAKFVMEMPQDGSYAGPRTRDKFLKQLPTIMAHDRHHQH